MTGRVFVIAMFSLAVQGIGKEFSADKLVDRLIDRTLKVQRNHRADLENTVLGKGNPATLVQGNRLLQMRNAVPQQNQRKAFAHPSSRFIGSMTSMNSFPHILSSIPSMHRHHTTPSTVTSALPEPDDIENEILPSEIQTSLDAATAAEYAEEQAQKARDFDKKVPTIRKVARAALGLAAIVIALAFKGEIDQSVAEDAIVLAIFAQTTAVIASGKAVDVAVEAKSAEGLASKLGGKVDAAAARSAAGEVAAGEASPAGEKTFSPFVSESLKEAEQMAAATAEALATTGTTPVLEEVQKMVDKTFRSNPDLQQSMAELAEAADAAEAAVAQTKAKLEEEKEQGGQLAQDIMETMMSKNKADIAAFYNTSNAEFEGEKTFDFTVTQDASQDPKMKERVAALQAALSAIAPEQKVAAAEATERQIPGNLPDEESVDGILKELSQRQPTASTNSADGLLINRMSKSKSGGD